jgi:hypothetical protein
MRTSMVGVALLLAGTGAAGLAAAVDTNGTGLALNGSDTLFDVTSNDVFSACSTKFMDWTTNPLTYQGGGSRVGAGNMVQDLQAVSPMSSALKTGEFCAPVTSGGTPSSVYSSPAVASAPGLTAGLLVGLDGVAISANQVMSCSQTNGAANGLGNGSPTGMAVLSGGTGTATGATYIFGDPAGTIYKNQPSFDALAVLYFGLTHDKLYSGCGSDVRKTLIKSWKNLFSSDCGTGDTTCSAGLTHAWRRSDLSGTTDAFVSILNPPAGTTTNGKGAAVAVGIGALPQFLSAANGGTGLTTAPGAVEKSNPFCNSADANFASAPLNATSAPITPGGSSDFSDLDPARTACVKGVDGVCEGFLAFATGGGHSAGDLGVVLPILIPDATSVHVADRYPQTTCSAACAPIPAFKGSQSSHYTTFLCPSGALPVGGNLCWMPYAGTDTSQNFQCAATATDKCGDIVGGSPDGRRYNLVTVVPSSQVPAAYKAGNFQFAIDASTPVARILAGSFHKIHSVVPAQNYAAGVGSPAETGTTGVCQEGDDTSQIGCLTDSDPCSIGYAGRESAQGFPGVSVTDPVTGITTIVPTSQQLKGLAINGIPPYTPPNTATCLPTTALPLGTACVPGTNGTAGSNTTLNPDGTTTTDANFGIESLVATPGTSPLYPLSRRLYFATIYGFQNLQGHENELAECYGTTSIMSSAMTNNGFVPVPTGVLCEDYPETLATSVSPAANVQGPGNAALVGCGSASNTDACVNLSATDHAAAHDINGIPVPELDLLGNTVTY